MGFLQRLRSKSSPPADTGGQPVPLGTIVGPLSPLDTGHRMRRLETAVKVNYYVAGTSATVALFAIAALILTLQRATHVVPVFVETSPRDQLTYRILPMEQGRPALRLASVGWARRFVQNRHSITSDETDMIRRLEWIKERSSDALWQEMSASLIDGVRNALRQRQRRTVTIRTSAEVAPGLFEVDFQLRILQGERELSNEVFRARVRVAFRSGTISASAVAAPDDFDDVSKLFGFQVVSYEVVSVGGQ
jgi:type IV secretory pathway component VirB8